MKGLAVRISSIPTNSYHIILSNSTNQSTTAFQIFASAVTKLISAVGPIQHNLKQIGAELFNWLNNLSPDWLEVEITDKFGTVRPQLHRLTFSIFFAN